MTSGTISRCPRCSAEVPAGFAFCGRCGQPVAARPSGERRHVTVLFLDVQGFTARSEGMDPEDVRDWMGGWLERFGRIVEDEGGHVDKYTGDGLMALFGAPVAHEDDPHRACGAALAMLRLTGEDGPRIRIGLHTGLVIAGHVGAATGAYTAMGETVNVASRLEQAARPGSALASVEVARLTDHRFAYGPVRPLELKGKTERVEARELVGERADGEPEELRAALVGRSRELQIVLQRLQGADPKTRRVEVLGELGIGKTRFAEEVLARLPGWRALRVTPTDRSRRGAYGLLRLLVSGAVDHVGGGDAAADTVLALTRALAGTAQGWGPHLPALRELTVPADAPATPASPDPRTRQRMIAAAVAALLAALGERDARTLLVIDGWERADAGSAALLDALASRPRGLGIPALVLSRPESRTLASGGAVVLSRLDVSESARLLDELVPGADLPAPLRQHVLDRAAGVPLHLIEMVRALVDAGVLKRLNGRWTCAQGVETPPLPPSLRAAMVARLDRVGPAERGFLGRCAVQGAEFEVSVLEAAADPGDSAAATTLHQMERRGLVAPLDRGGTRWTFRHPLLAEAAYELLLLQRRRELHARVARILVDRAGGEDGVAPHVLAHHWEHAEAWSDAARLQLRAGEVAAGVYLNAVALRWFERALESVARIDPPSAEDQRVAVGALAGAAEMSLLAGAYDAAAERAAAMAARSQRAADRAAAGVLAARAHLGRGRADEGEARLREAVQDARAEPEAGRRVAVTALSHLAAHLRLQGRTDEALEAVAQAREALRPEDLVPAVQLDAIEGRIAHTAGRYEEARARFRRAYLAARRAGDLAARAAAANDLGNVARDRGDYVAARGQFRRALALWRRIGDAEAVAGASVNLANLAMSVGDLGTARRYHEESRAASEEIGNVAGTALAWANLAILALEEGDAEGALRACEAAEGVLGSAGYWVLRGQLRVVAGEARLLAGDLAGARAVFLDVLERYDEAAHPLARAGALRGLGRLALADGAADRAIEIQTRAGGRFEKLQREQEAARTQAFLAEAYEAAGDRDSALRELDRARARLTAIRAARDVERLDRLRQRWSGHPGKRKPAGLTGGDPAAAVADSAASAPAAASASTRTDAPASAQGLPPRRA